MFDLFSLLCSAFFSMSCLGLSRTSPLQIPVLPSSMSSPDKRSAFRGSLDCRVKPDNDSIIFSSVIPERFPVMFGLEPNISFTDSRVKHGNDRGEEKSPAMTKRKISMNMTGKNKSPAMTILFFLMLDF
ncbi:MAG TPA: hypothetical protein IAD29_08070 [Candidatus Scatocola faecigallinarum]|nr:hypothetical protein [Candidatus Scatocola faecigallinarum]